MLPIHEIIWQELQTKSLPARVPEPTEAMCDAEQVRSYVAAYDWGGPTSALQLNHLRELSRLIRPGGTVLDLACGPGPLLLELAPLYPDTRFVGVDLSREMLDYLASESAARGLKNVSVVREDIRTLPSFLKGDVDMIISTSALHHLPDDEGLRQVFERISSLLGPDGAFYLFDFGLLRSVKTRQLFVAEVAKLAPPITVQDYEHSLGAAFPIEFVMNCAINSLPRPFIAQRSAFVDFFYFLRSMPREKTPQNIERYINERWRDFSMGMRMEHMMMRFLNRGKRITR